MKKYICIHGHFYQPPRENPWLEEVELQDSAHPFHDWNERITAECYGPNTCSRILDSEQCIADIVNNYSMISFNFGPTLLSWMERHQPEVYNAILEADQLSMKRFDGHGSAMAQVYNHMIMPLATRRDKITQARWGVEDFRLRFGRLPEGMWLPETAVDLETLEVLVDLGIRFTVLAPRQASRVRAVGDEMWRDVSDSRVDPTTVYKCLLPSGRSIALYFYDGPISQDLAFGDMLNSGETYKARLMAAFTDNDRDWPQLVHVATDGESYGHHHSYGEMALAWALRLTNQDPDVELTNYSKYLKNHPPVMEVDIFENSSWSCIHGVERWRADCGCNSGMHPDWHQGWRAPLREAVNWLGERVDDVFTELGPRFFHAPWSARDAYIQVMLDRGGQKESGFLREYAQEGLGAQELVQALKLLEMQRFGQLTFTSCGWFFDEISGIETVQILQYAVRALQLAEELSGEVLEERFLAMLEKAPSNVLRNGAAAYRDHAKPAKVDLLRVAAHYAITSLFEDYPEEYEFASYSVVSEIYNRTTAGRSHLVTGKVRMTSKITKDYSVLQFAVLHPGDHNVTCGVSFFTELDSFRRMENALAECFEYGNITESIRTMDAHFGQNTFTLWHLFKDEQRMVVQQVLEPIYALAEASYRQIYESNYSILKFLDHLHVPPPGHFMDAARYVINHDLKELFEGREMDVDTLDTLIGEAMKWGLHLERDLLGFKAAEWINRRMEDVRIMFMDIEMMDNLKMAMEHLQRLPLGLHHWKAQNTFFWMARKHLPGMRARAKGGEPKATQWLETFTALGELLHVRLT